MTKIFSSGGGVQSTAALVLSAQGKIDYPIHVFANVGAKAENPKTLVYVEEVLKPYAAKHGMEWDEYVDRYREEFRAIVSRFCQWIESQNEVVTLLCWERSGYHLT